LPEGTSGFAIEVSRATWRSSVSADGTDRIARDGACDLIEGWQGDDYLVLFDETESRSYSARYEIGRYLAGYVLVGLKSWDDFIVRGVDEGLATVPTVPVAAEHLTPLNISIDHRRLQPDSRFAGKVKWHTKPIVFGGDPSSEDNRVWVTLEEHVQLVKWWNDRYQDLTSE
jgi:hypothetical protein